MKKVLVIAIAVVLVFAVSITAFAAPGNADSEATVEKTEMAEKEISAEDRAEKLKALFVTYYEDGVEELDEIQAAHISFHENAKLDREALRAAVEAERGAIKAAIESGDLTKREGRVEFIELRIGIRDMRNDVDELLLDKIEAQAPVHDRMIEVRTEMKALLETEPVDSESIQVLLVETLSLLTSHLENDQLYHGLFMDAVAGYGF